MATKQIKIGKFTRASMYPKYTDGRCTLRLPKLIGADADEIILAERMRRDVLHAFACEIYEEFMKLSVSQMETQFRYHEVSSLSEIVHGYVTARFSYLSNLMIASEVIEALREPRQYHFHLDPIYGVEREN